MPALQIDKVFIDQYFGLFLITNRRIRVSSLEGNGTTNWHHVRSSDRDFCRGGFTNNICP